jgi:hypothetical protein
MQKVIEILVKKSRAFSYQTKWDIDNFSSGTRLEIATPNIQKQNKFLSSFQMVPCSKYVPYKILVQIFYHSSEKTTEMIQIPNCLLWF